MMIGGEGIDTWIQPHRTEKDRTSEGVTRIRVGMDLPIYPLLGAASQSE